MGVTHQGGVSDLFCGVVCVNGSQHVSLLSNTEYVVQLFANATAFTNSFAVVDAFADPYIHIDPTGGDQFSLLISDGIGNDPLATIPLPGTVPLFGAGLAGLGLLGGRRKRKLAAAV